MLVANALSFILVILLGIVIVLNPHPAKTPFSNVCIALGILTLVNLEHPKKAFFPR